MSAPGHDWKPRDKDTSAIDDDEEDDPVDKMIEKTGCIEEHREVQVRDFSKMLVIWGDFNLDVLW